jgi:predicted CXXCH cytochrome family protein
VVLVVAMMLVAAPAHAYYTETTSAILADPPPCESCHGIASPSLEDSAGPHGGYTTTTNKCATCHSVHTAPSGYKLLPASTVKGTCETCHDGTGGKGVYGVLASRGVTQTSGHEIEVTSIVPGGSATTGDTSTITFSGQSGYLTCTDCHSPHANSANMVQPFAGDRARSATDTVYISSRLLKKQPVADATATAYYGSDWCGSCHRGRLSGSGPANNHPVDSSITTTTVFDSSTTTAPPFFIYNNVAVVSGANSTQTVMGPLGHSNFGYVMPDLSVAGEVARTPLQTGHYPICMQCHEDARVVGNVEGANQQVDSTEQFSITATDGVAVNDNPRFQTFPHESPNTAMLLESPLDNLCLNCHNQAQVGD